MGARQIQIEKLYTNILNLGQERAKRLSETCKAYQLVREAAELANWIKTKEQHAQIQVKHCRVGKPVFINMTISVIHRVHSTK